MSNSDSQIEKQIQNEEVYEVRVFSDSFQFLMDSNIFSDQEKLYDMIEEFEDLPAIQQIGILKHVKEVLNGISLNNIDIVIQSFFQNEEQFENDVVFNLLEQMPLIIDFLNSKLKRARKRDNIFQKKRISNVQLQIEAILKNQKPKEMISYNDYKKYIQSILDYMDRTFDSKNFQVREKNLSCLTQVFLKLPQDEKDYMVLPVILKLLHDNKNFIKPMAGLQFLVESCQGFSTQIVEGFVTPEIMLYLDSENKLVQKFAWETFAQVIRISSGLQVRQKFTFYIEKAAKSHDLELQSFFLQIFDQVVEKLDYRKVMNFYIHQYMSIHKTKSKVLLRRFYKSLFKICEALLRKLIELDKQDLCEIENVLNIYFNLHLHLNQIDLLNAKQIVHQNYKQMQMLFFLVDVKLWPYLKMLLTSIDKQQNIKFVQEVKLALIKPIGQISEVLGQKIVEKELLPLIHRHFLSINQHTPSIIKVQTIKILSQILKDTKPQIRKLYADFYLSLKEIGTQWRIRLSILNQFDDLLHLFQLQEIISFIIPLYMMLCQDQCSLVRDASIKYFPKFIQYFNRHDQGAQFMVLSKIENFYYEDSVQSKILFLSFYQQMKSISYIDQQEIDEKFFQLIQSTNISIRIKCFLVFFKQKKYYKEEQQEKIDSLFEKEDSQEVKNAIKNIDFENMLNQFFKFLNYLKIIS